jgi:hypothetical protein
MLPERGRAGGPPLPQWATDRTILQKVKAKQWALAGGEVAMQSVTVVKEKLKNFDETAARSELLPRSRVTSGSTLSFGALSARLGDWTVHVRQYSSTQYVKILTCSEVYVSRGYRSAAG